MVKLMSCVIMLRVMYEFSSILRELERCFSFSFYCSCFDVSSDQIFHTLGQRQKGIIARSILLRPGGKLACELARHAVVLKVNDWVFCHGGLLPHHGKQRVPKFWDVLQLLVMHSLRIFWNTRCWFLAQLLMASRGSTEKCLSGWEVSAKAAKKLKSLF